MKTIDIIKKEFPKVNEKLLVSQGINEIEVLNGYENIETPSEYYTKYIDSVNPVTPTTYLHNKNVQCSQGRNRSFTDLYAIVRAKFMDLTISEFAYIFMKFQENGDKQFYASYCGTVNKIVCRCHKTHSSIIPAHWILENGLYIYNSVPNSLVMDLDKIIIKYGSPDTACDGVYESIIMRLANDYLKSKNDETAIIKD